MGAIVGIDLGTTNSVVAHMASTGRPEVLLNRFDAPTTPSVVCFTDDGILVGEPAKEMQGVGHPGAVAFFKRHMGDPTFSVYLGGSDRTPTELSSRLLAELKRDAEARLGRAVDRAVITVPAYFKNPQREATIAAGRAAGLEVLRVINEPTAAAVSYGMTRGEGERTLVVYDLGGGTFDVTVMRIEEGAVRVLTSVGDHELGGKDWDARIVDFIGAAFRDEHGLDPFDDVDTLGEMWVAAEAAKVSLSSRTRVSLKVVHGGERGRYPLERARFEDLTRDLMQRTTALTLGALDDVGLSTKDLDGALLVGGSTRMPMVQTFVEQQLGLTPLTGVNVDEAVALGAAIVAAEAAEPRRFALGGRTRTVDVTNHSLGMIAVNEDASAYVNSIILRKNMTVPCVQTRPYRHRGGGDLEVFMTQGESERPDAVTYLGRYVVRDVPRPTRRQAATVLDIRYAYDVSGTVEVHAAVRGASEALRVDVETLPADVPARFLEPPRTVSEHITVYLAFDLSGSMSGDPLDAARAAAHGFVDNIDLSHCSVGIIAFADNVAIKATASQNAKQIRKAIDRLSIGEVGIGNATDPFAQIYDQMHERAGPRFVVTLADGVWSRQDRAIERARRCIEAGIESIAIGFGGADRAFLERIASSSEASLFTQMSGLVETFSTIAQVITESGPAPAGGLSFFRR